MKTYRHIESISHYELARRPGIQHVIAEKAAICALNAAVPELLSQGMVNIRLRLEEYDREDSRIREICGVLEIGEITHLDRVQHHVTYRPILRPAWRKPLDAVGSFLKRLWNS